MAHCRKDHLEPPAPAKAMRLVTSAVNTFEERLCQATGRLSATTRTLLGEPVVEDTGDDASVGGGQPFLAELKADPGGGGEPAREDRQAGAGAEAPVAAGVVRRYVGEAGGRLAGSRNGQCRLALAVVDTAVAFHGAGAAHVWGLGRRSRPARARTVTDAVVRSPRRGD